MTTKELRFAIENLGIVCRCEYCSTFADFSHLIQCESPFQFFHLLKSIHDKSISMNNCVFLNSFYRVKSEQIALFNSEANGYLGDMLESQIQPFSAEGNKPLEPRSYKQALIGVKTTFDPYEEFVMKLRREQINNEKVQAASAGSQINNNVKKRRENMANIQLLSPSGLPLKTNTNTNINNPTMIKPIVIGNSNLRPQVKKGAKELQANMVEISHCQSSYLPEDCKHYSFKSKPLKNCNKCGCITQYELCLRCLSNDNIINPNKIAQMSNETEFEKSAQNSLFHANAVNKNVQRQLVATGDKNSNYQYSAQNREDGLHDGHFSESASCYNNVNVNNKYVLGDTVGNLACYSTTALLLDDGLTQDHRRTGNLAYSKRNIVIKAIQNTHLKSRLNLLNTKQSNKLNPHNKSSKSKINKKSVFLDVFPVTSQLNQGGSWAKTERRSEDPAKTIRDRPRNGPSANRTHPRKHPNQIQKLNNGPEHRFNVSNGVCSNTNLVNNRACNVSLPSINPILADFYKVRSDILFEENCLLKEQISNLKLQLINNTKATDNPEDSSDQFNLNNCEVEVQTDCIVHTSPQVCVNETTVNHSFTQTESQTNQFEIKPSNTMEVKSCFNSLQDQINNLNQIQHLTNSNVSAQVNLYTHLSKM